VKKSLRKLNRLLKESFPVFEEDKLKLIPHGSSMAYGLTWDMLQLVLPETMGAISSQLLRERSVVQPAE
jgi:hypothetical protein